MPKPKMKSYKTLEIKLPAELVEPIKDVTSTEGSWQRPFQSIRGALKKVGDDYRKETMKVLRISFLSSLALELVATLSVALLAVTIGLRLVSGSISLDTGLFVLIIAPEVYWPIRQVANCAPS